MLEKTSRIHNDPQRFRQFFENCFHLYYESLHRYAYTIVKNNHDAADIVQFVFTKWWSKGESLVIQQDIRHYLYRTVRNQALNHVRNLKNRKTDLRDFTSDAGNISDLDPGDPVIKKELMNKLKAELENLPPQCKLIFIKSRFEQKKYAEIAEELNLSIKTIETQIGKALKILRRKLFEDRINILTIISWLINNIF